MVMHACSRSSTALACESRQNSCSFKLKEKRREAAKVMKRYHPPSTPCERALTHPEVAAAVKKRLREQYRTLDPVALLANIRAAQEELGNRVDRRAGDARGRQRAGKGTGLQPLQLATPDAVAFAKTLGNRLRSVIFNIRVG